MRRHWGKYTNSKITRSLSVFSQKHKNKKHLSSVHPKHHLLNSLKYNDELVLSFFKLIDLLSEEHLEMSYAGKWIIENRDTLVEEVGLLNGHISKKLLKILPAAADEPFSPRLLTQLRQYYRLQKKVTEESLNQYFQTVQSKEPLTLNEVFSMPLFLKFIVIDTVVDLLSHVMLDTRARNDIAFVYHDSTYTPRWRDVLKRGKEYALYFAVHLSQYHISPSKTGLIELQRQALQFIQEEQELYKRCTNIIQGEEIGKYIRDLQRIKELDWDLVFKQISVVHCILSKDPAGMYPLLDTQTRNSYLDEFKRISRVTGISENQLAETIVMLADSADESYRRHVGFYIIDGGRSSVHPKLRPYRGNGGRASLSTSLYLASILILLGGVYIFVAVTSGLVTLPVALLGLLVLLPLYSFVKQLVNSILTDLVAPRRLSRLELQNGLPASDATMFVVPSLLINKSDIKRLVDSLEVVHLANKGDNIYFSLLLDYRDALQKEEAADQALFRQLQDAIAKLNRKYRSKNKFSFYLRERLWSERQQRWMGWERKRGKLLEFTNLLRGQKTISDFYFSLSDIPEVKYLITVDEDAIIPKDFIHDLVGTISHPLNRAVYDADSGKLLRGYVILQPRLNFSFKAKHQSVLSQSLCDARGYDFYSRLLNELYFDLFAEGHYTGKGIIDIDGFIKELNGRLPDDTILSHDLLEGALCGTGYVSDIVIYEGFPSTVRSFLMRDHRWIRGNWQIIDWIFNNVRDQQGEPKPNKLTVFQKFKVFDNMLVSLMNPVLFTLLILSWLLFPETRSLVYILLFLEFFLLEFALGLYFLILRHARGLHLLHFLNDLQHLLRNLFSKNAFYFLFLPYDAYLKIDAIIKAMYRKYISKRHTLQWATFVASESAKNKKLAGYVKIFAPSWLFLAAVLVASIWFGFATYAILLLITVWLLVPLWTMIYDTEIAHE